MEAYVVAGKRLNAEKRPYERVQVVPWPSVWNPLRVFYRSLEMVGAGRGGRGWRALWPNLEEEVSRISPDVLHAHFGRSGVKAVPVANRLGLPLVVTFYGYDISQLPRERSWREAYEGIWETAAAIVVLSKEMKQRAMNLGAPPENIHVVHLARDLNSFSYQPPDPPLSEIVTVGRLTEKKGHYDAIEVVGRVVERGKKLRLRIVGDGPLREELKRYIRKKNLGAFVELMGPRPNAEVANILKESDFFLLCSKTSPDGDREGTPTVLIEAQAIGLPCVSTTHAGIPEMIPEDNHQFLAEEGDVGGIESCLRRLLGCSQEGLRQITKKGRGKIEKDFQLSREVQRLRKIYEHVTGST